jgi:hypothetical protein
METREKSDAIDHFDSFAGSGILIREESENDERPEEEGSVL